jgi:glyoxylase I family protein
VTDGGGGRPDPTTGPMTGLSHVQLRVTDVTASAEWYTAALGLEPFQADPAIGYVALRHPTSRVVIVLTTDTSGTWLSDGGPLDHLAFAVPDGATLEAWADHLTSVGIDHPGVVPENDNPSLQLRDPDGTAVELVAPRPRAG